MWKRFVDAIQKRLDDYENERRLSCFMQRADNTGMFRVQDTGYGFVFLSYRGRIAGVLTYNEIVYDVVGALDRMKQIEQMELHKESERHRGR